MQNEDYSKAITYVGKKPDIEVLRQAYQTTDTDLQSYYDLCRTSYDDRRNWWPGKSRDLRKHGSDAFPWEGASDLESHVIDERVTRLVSLFMSALNRANIQAFPVEATDIPRAKVVSNFLKWMTTSGYIPRFKQEMELAANYMLERGVMITYCGWVMEDRTFKQKIDLRKIAAASPELAEMIASGQNDEMVIQQMQSAVQVSEGNARKALEELRETGMAEVPTVRRQVNAPEVKTVAPDGDFIFPAYVTDPQRAPYCFWRTYYTAQELQNKVSTDGWDANFVEHVIENFSGVNIHSLEREQEGRRSVSVTDDAYQAEELIEIIHGYQRLIDEEDNSEGIYETVFHESFSGDEGLGIKGYAKFELLNGYEDYPVVVTRFSEDTKRLYDAMTVPSLLRGIQNQVKVERDSRIDSNSLSTLPAVTHPKGRKPEEIGPGRFIPEVRTGEIRFMQGPGFNPGSVEMENNLQQQADRMVGLDEESPLSSVRRQFLVDKYLQHIAQVIATCYKNFQRFGPDEVFFNVTGIPDPQMFNKGNPNENYDVTISFDVLNASSEKQEAKLNQLVSLVQMDRNGLIDVDKLLTAVAGSIDPVLATGILRPAQEAQDKMLKDITDDLSKIYAGIEVPARPNGAQAALQIIQSYVQQPDVAKRLQEDEAFAQRLQKYNAQYQFVIQQAQNAQIGRVGTAPAQMGEVQTQGMQQ
jgi:ribosomal protein S8